MSIDEDITETSQGSNPHLTSIGSDDGLVLNWWHAIIWTSESLVYWYLYAFLSLGELTMWQKVWKRSWCVNMYRYYSLSFNVTSTSILTWHFKLTTLIIVALWHPLAWQMFINGHWVTTVQLFGVKLWLELMLTYCKLHTSRPSDAYMCW